MESIRKFRIARHIALCVSLFGAMSACSLSEPPTSPQQKPRAIVLIVVDTLRADHLGLYGYPRDTSPALDRWAQTATVFDHAFASAPWTLPSVSSILTGHEPFRHGAGGGQNRDGGRGKLTALTTEHPTLAQVLIEHGYETGAIVTNGFLSPAFGAARGFTTYDFSGEMTPARQVDRIVDAALSWIDLAGGPYFLMLHLLDPHLPYAPPPAVRGRFTSEIPGEWSLPWAVRSWKHLLAIQRGRTVLEPDERAFLTAAYDEEIAFLDAELGRLLGGLRERGVLDDGLVLLTADHGEELFDHGSFEHGHTMYQELLHVPMMAWGRSVPRGHRVEQPVSVIDVMPMVLDAAGLSPDGFDGESLWPAMKGIASPVDSRLLAATHNAAGPALEAAIRWPLKLIRGPNSPKLFDLAADPAELHDLATARPADVERMSIALDAHLKRHAAAPLVEPHLDDEQLEDLRALGYIE